MQINYLGCFQASSFQSAMSQSLAQTQSTSTYSSGSRGGYVYKLSGTMTVGQCASSCLIFKFMYAGLNG